MHMASLLPRKYLPTNLASSKNLLENLFRGVASDKLAKVLSVTL